MARFETRNPPWADHNAVRAHLVTLQKQGLVRRGGLQTGTRKPHIVYALTENAIHALPNAYGLLLRAFVGVLAKQLSPQTLMGDICVSSGGNSLGTRHRRRTAKAQRTGPSRP